MDILGLVLTLYLCVGSNSLALHVFTPPHHYDTWLAVGMVTGLIGAQFGLVCRNFI